MAHLLQARQGGVVVEAKVKVESGSYQFSVEVHKWDEKASSAVKCGNRNFPLPSSLWHSYSIGHLKLQLGNVLPPTTPGGEHGGDTYGDDKKLSEISAPSADSPATVFLIFNLDKSAPTAGSTLQHSLSSSGLGPVKAGVGPITSDRELAVEFSLYSDSGTNYITVKGSNPTQGVNYEGKWTVSENYLSSTSLKELKGKLIPPIPKTSDRGLLKAASGTKNIKDSDKLGALGVKGKKGDTLKFSFSFELAPVGGAAAAKVTAVPVVGAALEPAPDIEAKWRYHVSLNVSLMEGNIFLSFTGNSEPDREGGALPEAKKSAALPKMTFSVFNFRELIGLFKGNLWPTFLPGWCVFERPGGEKVKVLDSMIVEKVGVFCPPTGSNTYKFFFAIDPNHTLPTA